MNKERETLKEGKTPTKSHTNSDRTGATTLCFYFLIQGSFHSTIATPFHTHTQALWKVSISAICWVWKTFCVCEFK